ncbi:Chemotaxis regulator - transmits chemoreceptor signals to flagelllar motor components CheY [Fulvivirga imtechensis AK7]|uniref:Chemotaxis regulator-transmits chemoreceptor signals to flagelllar motor components CheY n=1 Tax=Fulvivirga imtechensis AK7 TaxID=1237149 RepID=L8JVN5_9BACT|nr:response regulator [Fulvivirga imtechensis]ELR71282.1 Chemotaxis regulator - transmits chemoreceptor signals to flagelllar motor components CheY [Fulvivirga imtechensis AK7]
MKKTILICDDDKDILELCTFILIKNYHIKTAPEISSARHLIAEQQPDLVLMDLWIPKIGGEAALSELKKSPDTASIPIILFSANEKIKTIASDLNADGYIKKPFSVQYLKSYISEKIGS